MHDIWNPWHGCIKKSEGCQNCYMYFLDRKRNADGAKIYRVKNNFFYPLQRNTDGTYKIKSGECLRVCLTSDFFLAEADKWRDQAWEIIKQRPDVGFFLLTKRPERVAEHLPQDWGNGWDNVFFSVTAENQKRADERLPLLMDLPFKHKGVMTAPFIGEISLLKWLKSGKIEQVIAGGENYDGQRILQYEWVKKLYDECRQNNVTFCFIETGTKFAKDGKIYTLLNKRLQSEMAFKSGLQFAGKPIEWQLRKPQGELFADDWYIKHWRQPCNNCGSRLICNGCSDCGLCEKNKETTTK